MTVKLLNETEYVSSKALWTRCFGDGEMFTEWYYRARTKPEYVLGAFDGELIGMLHMRPVVMRLAGKERKVCFVAGVCTAPEYRRRGVCAELFEKAFPIMRKRAFEATVLQPFDPGFYERFGYRVFIYRRAVRVRHKLPDPQRRQYDAKLLSDLYGDFIREYEGASVRDEKYFEGFIEEFTSPSARLVVTEEGCCAGYADEDGLGFTAYELFYKKGADPVSLLPGGFERYAFPLPVNAKAPGDPESTVETFSVIKPLDPALSEELLRDGASFYGFDKY